MHLTHDHFRWICSEWKGEKKKEKVFQHWKSLPIFSSGPLSRSYDSERALSQYWPSWCSSEQDKLISFDGLFQESILIPSFFFPLKILDGLFGSTGRDIRSIRISNWIYVTSRTRVPGLYKNRCDPLFSPVFTNGRQNFGLRVAAVNVLRLLLFPQNNPRLAVCRAMRLNNMHTVCVRGSCVNKNQENPSSRNKRC